MLTIGVSMHPDPEVRVCDTLDWYAPRYLSRHTPEEVRGWFTEAGLVDVTDLSAGQVHYHAGPGQRGQLCWPEAGLMDALPDQVFFFLPGLIDVVSSFAGFIDVEASVISSA